MLCFKFANFFLNAFRTFETCSMVLIGHRLIYADLLANTSACSIYNRLYSYQFNRLYAISFTVSDARKVRCTGRGLQKHGVRVRDVADFKVYTEGAGEGKLEVKIIGPGGVQEQFDMKKVDATTFEYKYFPKTPGRYTVLVQYGGQEVPKSPFEVNVGKYITSKVKAFGPGLESGVVGHSADFYVEMNGETAPLGTIKH